MKKEICKKCNHEWVSRTENPKMCPRCKRYIVYEVGKQEAEEVKITKK